MPSSPEILVSAAERLEPRPFELAELGSGRLPAAVELPQFRPAHVVVPDELEIFEVRAEFQLTAEDRTHIAEARRAAEAAGYARGWSQGMRESHAAAEAELQGHRAAEESAAHRRDIAIARALSAVHRSATELEARAIATVEQLEQSIIDSAFTIAEAIVGVALRDDQVRGASVLTRALSLAPSGEHVTVSVSADDYAVLTESGTDQLREARSRRIAFVLDDSLQPGDAVAQWSSTAVDARLSAGIARVRDVLGRTDEELPGEAIA